jgi:hypothetical protein
MFLVKLHPDTAKRLNNYGHHSENNLDLYIQSPLELMDLAICINEIIGRDAQRPSYTFPDGTTTEGMHEGVAFASCKCNILDLTALAPVNPSRSST